MWVVLIEFQRGQLGPKQVPVAVQLVPQRRCRTGRRLRRRHDPGAAQGRGPRSELAARSNEYRYARGRIVGGGELLSSCGRCLERPFGGAVRRVCDGRRAEHVGERVDARVGGRVRGAVTFCSWRGKGSIASRRKVLPAAEYSECRSVARSAHAHAAHALCSMEW